MRQGSSNVAHLTFLQNQGYLNRVSKFSTFFMGTFLLMNMTKQPMVLKSHLSIQRQGFPDSTRCPQQLRGCNCRDNCSARAILGLEYSINSTQKCKTWPHCNVCNIKVSTDLSILNYTQSLSLSDALLS